MKHIWTIISCLTLYANMACADTTVVQLNTQIQAQLKQLQTQQEDQLKTLNSQLQTQMQKMQTTLQNQIQALNSQTQNQMKQMQTTLEQQINQVHQDIKKP